MGKALGNWERGGVGRGGERTDGGEMAPGEPASGGKGKCMDINERDKGIQGRREGISKGRVYLKLSVSQRVLGEVELISRRRGMASGYWWRREGRKSRGLIPGGGTHPNKGRHRMCN